MRELLGMPAEFEFKNPDVITDFRELLGVPLFGIPKIPQIVVGLGCSYGCDFCSPSDDIRFYGRHLRGPPPVSPGGGVLAAGTEGVSGPTRRQALPRAPRADRGQLGPLRAGHEPARRARGPPSSTASCNGSSIALVAHEINVQKLLDDVKAYIKTRPRQMEVGEDQRRRHRLSTGHEEPDAVPGQGSGLVADGGQAPARGTSTSGVTITTPLQKAGVTNSDVSEIQNDVSQVLGSSSVYRGITSYETGLVPIVMRRELPRDGRRSASSWS